MTPLRLRLTRAIVLRLLADVVMINTSLVLSLTARYFWLVDLQDKALPNRKILVDYIHMYASSAWLLTTISVVVFLGTGFYTRGRAYRSRYKALTIAQAVSVSYLIFGCVVYVFDGRVQVPRLAVIVSWGLTLVALTTVRVWVALWTKASRIEQRLVPRPGTEHKIESVLVIGGDGYIGSAVIPKLLARGYYVRILSLFLYGTDSIQKFIKHPRLEILHADFRQVDKVVEAMRDVDAVIHLGAIVGDPACALDEELTIDVNVMATRMIAEVAKGHGVNRFIFASTCSVYGASDETLDENSALVPVSLYARSKIACERILVTMADDRFVPVYLRFGTIYGLSGRSRFDLVVNLLSAKAVVDGEITLMGKDQWRPFVHVEDAATAILKTLEAPRYVVRNEVFNVGSDDQNRTIGEIGQLIHAAVPAATIRDVGSADDRRNYRVSFAKIRNKLQFEPNWTLERGIEQVIAAVRLGTIDDYRNPKYSNVKFLSEDGAARLLRRPEDWARDLLADVSSDSETSGRNPDLESRPMIESVPAHEST